MPSIVRTSAPSRSSAKTLQAFTDSAVDMHHAGAALAGVAADMRAGQPQPLAQEIHQQRPALHLADTARPLTVRLTIGMSILPWCFPRYPWRPAPGARPGAERGRQSGEPRSALRRWEDDFGRK